MDSDTMSDPGCYDEQYSPPYSKSSLALHGKRHSAPPVFNAVHYAPPCESPYPTASKTSTPHPSITPQRRRVTLPTEITNLIIKHTLSANINSPDPRAYQQTAKSLVDAFPSRYDLILQLLRQHLSAAVEAHTTEVEQMCDEGIDDIDGHTWLVSEETSQEPELPPGWSCAYCDGAQPSVNATGEVVMRVRWAIVAVERAQGRSLRTLEGWEMEELMLCVCEGVEAETHGECVGRVMLLRDFEGAYERCRPEQLVPFLWFSVGRK